MLEGSEPRPRLPMGMTCIDGNPVECKVGKVLSTPTHKTSTGAGHVCLGRERQLKKPKPHLGERHQSPLGRESKARGVLRSTKCCLNMDRHHKFLPGKRTLISITVPCQHGRGSSRRVREAVGGSFHPEVTAPGLSTAPRPP